MLAQLFLLLFMVGGCGDDDIPSDTGLENVVESHPGSDPLPPFDECSVLTGDDPAESRMHFAPCTDLEYPVVPASSGAHYGIWADFATYDAPVPNGYLVHAMEHGGVVMRYDCDGDACDDILDAFETVIEEHGADPLCSTHPSAASRFIVVPDPSLDVPIAVAAWERVYRATCIDLDSLRDFVEEHYGQGPEDLCIPGANYAERGWCVDAGADGGLDAAVDAGADAEVDAGEDAPAEDGGADATLDGAEDAAVEDASEDAMDGGVDAADAGEDA